MCIASLQTTEARQNRGLVRSRGLVIGRWAQILDANALLANDDCVHKWAFSVCIMYTATTRKYSNYYYMHACRSASDWGRLGSRAFPRIFGLRWRSLYSRTQRRPSDVVEFECHAAAFNYSPENGNNDDDGDVN